MVFIYLNGHKLSKSDILDRDLLPLSAPILPGQNAQLK